MVLGGKRKFFAIMLAFCLPALALVSEVPVINITEKTDPKIAELYQQLQDSKEKIKEIESERLDKLGENYQAVKENEQSLANRTLTAASIAATGVGTMELAKGLSEQKADKEAQQDMAAYISSFRCEYGDGKQVKGGPDEIVLPGGNDEKLMSLRSEYLALAADLKERKTALGMKPGIESEEILDKTAMNLYDDENVGIDSGAYASIYRAQMLGSEEDQAKLDEDAEKSKNRVIGGAVAAGAGIVGGVAGNAIINKDAPKNESKKINDEYDKKLAEATKEQEELTQQLNDAIAQNAVAVKKYNDELQEHKDQINLIKQSPKDCQSLFDDYITEVSTITPVENETDAVPDTTFPELSKYQSLLSACTGCDTKGGVFDPETQQCPCPEDKPIEKDGKCVEKPVEVIPASETIVEPVEGTITEPTEETDVQEQSGEEVKEEPASIEEEVCPEKGNRLSSLNDGQKHKPGDFCSSSTITYGEVIWKKDSNPKVCTCLARDCILGYKLTSGRCVEDTGEDTGDNIKDCQQTEIDITPKNISPQALPGFITKAPRIAEEKCQEYAKKNNCNLIKHEWRPQKGKYIATCNPKDYCSTTYFKKNDKINTTDKCASFCKSKAEENNCKYKNSTVTSSQCICNPDEAALSEADIYKEVCGDDKGKTGKKEYCVEGVFNWVNVGELEAIGLAKLYAKEKHKNTITCSTKYRTSWNDDYLKCASLNGPYYEFQFDDIKEGTDATKHTGIVKGIAAIYGKESADVSIIGKCTSEITAAAKQFGYIAKSTKGSKLTGLATTKDGTGTDLCQLMAALHGDDFAKKIQEIDDVDPKVFYHGIQINAGQTLIGQLRDYVSSRGYKVSKFECNHSFYKMLTSASPVANYDDVLTCRLTGQGHGKTYNNKEIDFMFDDASESWLYVREKGESAIQCIVTGGSYMGEKCHGLDEKQCKDADKKLKNRFPGSSGTTWRNNECILNDAAEAKTYDLLVEAGTTLLSAADCLILTHTGCAVLAVETTAWVTEKVTDAAIGGRAEEFVKESYKCKARECAKNAIKTLGGRVLSVKNGLKDEDLHAVDGAFARLITFLTPEDLASEASSESDWEEMVKQLGGDPEDASGKALIVVNKIALFAQFASIGVSSLRLTGKAIAKIGAKAGNTKMVTIGTKLSKLGDKADDAAKVSKVVGKADDVVESTTRTSKKLSDIGIKEKRVSNVVQHVDSKTGEVLSSDQILTRMKQNPGKYEDFGIEAIKGSDGQVRLHDMNNQSRFISNDDALTRIKNGSALDVNDATSKADNVVETTKKTTTEPTETPAANTSNKATNDTNNSARAANNTPTPTTATKTPKTQNVQELEDKVHGLFSSYKKEVQLHPEKEVSFPKNRLSDAEWKTLNESLANENLELVQHGDDMILQQKRVSTGINNTGKNTAGKLDNVAETTKKPTAKPTQTPTRATPSASNIRTKASETLERDLAYIKDGQIRRTYIKKANLSDEELKVLSKDLDREGFAIIESDNPLSFAVVKKENVAEEMSILTGKVGPSSANKAVSTTPQSAEDVQKMLRQTQYPPAPVSSTAPSITDLRQTASKKFDTYLAEAKNSVNGKSEHIIPIERLDDTGWNTINKSLANENVQLVEITGKDGKQYMQFVRADAGASTVSQSAEDVQKMLRQTQYDLPPANVTNNAKSTASKVTQTPTKATPGASNIRTKASETLERDLAYIKDGQIRRTHIKKANLSDEELKALRQDLDREGFAIIESDNTSNFWVVKKEAVAEEQAIRINTLQHNAGGHFNEYKNEAFTNANGRSSHMIPKDKLPREHWTALNESMAHENVQLVEITGKDGKQYMQFVRADAGAGASLNKIDDATKATKNKNIADNFNMGGSKTVNTKSTPTNVIDNTANTTTETFATSQSNKQLSLTDIENKYQEKLHNDVLDLQKSYGMDKRADRFNNVLKQARETLPPEEYEAFEKMIDIDKANTVVNSKITRMTDNMRHSGEFSEEAIDYYTKPNFDALAHNKQLMIDLKESHPQASAFFSDNKSAIHAANDVDVQSQAKFIDKRIGISNEISSTVSDADISKSVKQFKENIINDFPKDMYQKAKNWDNMPINEKIKFVNDDVLPYIQKHKGLNSKDIEFGVMHKSEIGGDALYNSETKRLVASIEDLETSTFDYMFSTLAHENTHAAQHTVGAKSVLTPEIVDFSSKNYVKALEENLQANRNIAIEREAYETGEALKNILDDVAKKHGWH